MSMSCRVPEMSGLLAAVRTAPPLGWREDVSSALKCSLSSASVDLVVRRRRLSRSLGPWLEVSGLRRRENLVRHSRVDCVLPRCCQPTRAGLVEDARGLSSSSVLVASAQASFFLLTLPMRVLDEARLVGGV